MDWIKCRRQIFGRIACIKSYACLLPAYVQCPVACLNHQSLGWAATSPPRLELLTSSWKRFHLFLYVCQTVAQISNLHDSQKEIRGDMPARANGSENPTAMISSAFRRTFVESHEQLTHETPVSHDKESCLCIEWQIRARTLRVVEGTGELRPSGMEAAAG